MTILVSSANIITSASQVICKGKIINVYVQRKRTQDRAPRNPTFNNVPTQGGGNCICDDMSSTHCFLYINTGLLISP